MDVAADPEIHMLVGRYVGAEGMQPTTTSINLCGYIKVLVPCVVKGACALCG